MYYFEVGDMRSSLTREVLLNEIVSGQEWAYIYQNRIHEQEPEFDFDPFNYWVCLTGLPKSVYMGVYGQGADDMMKIFVRLEHRLEELWKAIGGKGEVILHLYGQKQIVLVFTIRSETKEREEALARETARTACEFLQAAYMENFLGDGRYHNAAFLSSCLHIQSGIGDAVKQLLTAWESTFFDHECRTYVGDEWKSNSGPEDRIRSQDLFYQIRVAVLSGNSHAVAEIFVRLFGELARFRDFYLLSSTLEQLKRECMGFQNSLNCHDLSEQDCNVCFDRSGYAWIGEMRDAIQAIFVRLAEKVNTADNPHGILADSAMRMIAEHIDDAALGLPFVAERLGISVNYLSTTFKRETGIGFAAYLNQMRMKRAEDLLMETSLLIVSVAGQCGFTDAKYFSTAFRKWKGCSPQQYRGQRGKEK